MTTSSSTDRGAAGLLALAASPTFALMAWHAAKDAPPYGVCSAGSSLLPIDGMTAMYVLMSFFHMAPWLRAHFRTRLERPSGARLLRASAHGRKGRSAPVLANTRQLTIPATF